MAICWPTFSVLIRPRWHLGDSAEFELLPIPISAHSGARGYGFEAVRPPSVRTSFFYLERSTVGFFTYACALVADDAEIIATADFQHALDGVTAGRDAYAEKPMAHTMPASFSRQSERPVRLFSCGSSTGQGHVQTAQPSTSRSKNLAPWQLRIP
jgi:hypothetical protein